MYLKELEHLRKGRVYAGMQPLQMEEVTRQTGYNLIGSQKYSNKIKIS